jgi:cytochrome c oxidase subunit 3
MSSAQPTTEYEKYYVPESSSLAVRATIGLVLTVFGGGLVLNEMTFGGTHDTGGTAKYVLFAGLAMFIATLTYWFRTAITENKAGMNSAQLSQSYVLGMFWFIFSEVMFFAAFFGTLLYVRWLAGPWLAGEGEGGRMNFLLWEGFEYTWPPVTTPQEVVGRLANLSPTTVSLCLKRHRCHLQMHTTGMRGCRCGTPLFCLPPV